MKKTVRLMLYSVLACNVHVNSFAATNNLPERLRVFTCAHSFHWFVPALLADITKSAGITNYVQTGVSRIGGSQVIHHWEKPDEENSAKQILKEGRVDILTLSPIWLPDDGIEKFGEFSVTCNPDIRILVNEFWLPNDTYEPAYPLRTKKVVDHNAATGLALKEQQGLYCREMQQHLERINSRLGKEVFFMVPVGHAVIALREKIIAGQAPGLKIQEDLFTDAWGHPQMPIKVLAAYCFYACMYQRSPAGLPPVENWGLNDELVHLLQELAWDAVTHHPMTGPAAEERPKQCVRKPDTST